MEVEAHDNTRDKPQITRGHQCLCGPDRRKHPIHTRRRGSIGPDPRSPCCAREAVEGSVAELDKKTNGRIQSLEEQPILLLGRSGN